MPVSDMGWAMRVYAGGTPEATVGTPFKGWGLGRRNTGLGVVWFVVGSCSKVGLVKPGELIKK